MKQQLIKTSEIVFREDLYPRINRDPALVQRYQANLECLPPIEVNQRNELIDGWHRWTAYKTAKEAQIPVIVTATSSDATFLALACRRNSTAGKQLEDADKRAMAVRLYASGTGLPKAEIAEVLSVTDGTVTRYLSEIDLQLREEREQKMTNLWLACHTLQAIADSVGLNEDTVGLFVQKIRGLGGCSKIGKSAIEHDDGFSPEIYSVWNFSEATNEVRHFGNIPPEILDNLLYYYTKPFDVVFDPFAGGGSTIDICRKRMRRYYASDLTPIEARRHEIRHHDIMSGLPNDLPVPDLVFLDPPYWKQARGQYSQSKTDLANVELELFLDSIASIGAAVKRKWTGAKRTGTFALIIGPCKEAKSKLDLALLCHARLAKYFEIRERVIVPYSTQVHGGAFVKMAQEQHEILYLHRDLLIYGN